MIADALKQMSPNAKLESLIRIFIQKFPKRLNHEEPIIFYFSNSYSNRFIHIRLQTTTS